MSTTPDSSQTLSDDLRQGIQLKFKKDLTGVIVMTLFLFLGAWRLNWLMGWLYSAASLAGIIINAVVLIRLNPELMAIRAKITQEETKGWDKVFTSLFGPLLLIIMFVCGLDAGRFEWSSVPTWLVIIAIIIFAAGWGFSLWAMVVNKHFETSVRIQDDREHKTVNNGPYQIVRHPGYLGMIGVYLSTPLFLKSWWGLVPTAILIGAFVWRTSKEDSTLQTELPDYKDYAKKVKYRIFPGIW